MDGIPQSFISTVGNNDVEWGLDSKLSKDSTKYGKGWPLSIIKTEVKIFAPY